MQEVRRFTKLRLAFGFESPDVLLRHVMFNRRTVITFEKLERNLYRMPDSQPVPGRCEACSGEVSWLTPNQVSALTGLSLREIFRGIEENKFHFTETAPGVLHICPNSIQLRKGER